MRFDRSHTHAITFGRSYMFLRSFLIFHNGLFSVLCPWPIYILDFSACQIKKMIIYFCNANSVCDFSWDWRYFRYYSTSATPSMSSWWAEFIQVIIDFWLDWKIETVIQLKFAWKREWGTNKQKKYLHSKHRENFCFCLNDAWNDEKKKHTHTPTRTTIASKWVGIQFCRRCMIRFCFVSLLFHSLCLPFISLWLLLLMLCQFRFNFNEIHSFFAHLRWMERRRRRGDGRDWN